MIEAVLVFTVLNAAGIGVLLWDRFKQEPSQTEPESDSITVSSDHEGLV